MHGEATDRNMPPVKHTLWETRDICSISLSEGIIAHPARQVNYQTSAELFKKNTFTPENPGKGARSRIYL